MLSEPRSIFFQTELSFFPIKERRFGKSFARKLYQVLSEPGGYAFDDLVTNEEPITLSTRRANGSSQCHVGSHEIVIVESEPQVEVDGFVEIVETILDGIKQTDHDCPPIFGQKCTIHCVAKTQGSDNSIQLLAGKVSNVMDAIQPFERPPLFFGIRFRFPPFTFVDENGASESSQGREDFVALRFETWEKDVEYIWVEIISTNIFEDALDISDKQKIGENMKDSYAFLTEKAINFLNQFDDREPDNSNDAED